MNNIRIPFIQMLAVGLFLLCLCSKSMSAECYETDDPCPCLELDELTGWQLEMVSLYTMYFTLAQFPLTFPGDKWHDIKYTQNPILFDGYDVSGDMNYYTNFKSSCSSLLGLYEISIQEYFDDQESIPFLVETLHGPRTSCSASSLPSSDVRRFSSCMIASRRVGRWR